VQLRVKHNINLTPLCADKAIYHLALTPLEPIQLDYEPGDWLTLQFENQQAWVQAVLTKLGLSGEEELELRRAGKVSAHEALLRHLEISQLNPALLNKIQRQYQLGDWADRQAMMDYAYGRDIVDLLAVFPELCELGLEFLKLLAPLAPRYYSIASTPVAVGNEVHLLVKLVAYVNTTVGRRMHYGVASYAISQLQSGERVECELKANPTFKLPQSPDLPIIMIGAGTGIAPFIGFIQQRIAQRASGRNLLFFGETHQACSFLFEDELTAWQQAGQIELFTAFSRDQPEKCYVQHRVQAYKQVLWSLMEQGAHLYICGSQQGLTQGVTETWLDMIMEFSVCDREGALQIWQAWRKSKRLQMDVY